MDMQNVSSLQIPEGAVRTIHDKDNRLIWGRLAYGTKYAGNTVQNGTPTPDTPIAVQTVTGEQTVTVTGDDEASQSYTISLGAIELCKIGTYQDYIYKSGDGWYVHKEIKKVDMSSISDWGGNGNGQFYKVGFVGLYGIKNDVLLSNIFTYSNTTWAGVGKFGITSGNNLWCQVVSTMSDSSAFPAWLASYSANLYGILLTATDTQITDATLIEQLEAIHEWLTRYGYNATVTGNLPLIVDRTNL